MIDSKLYEPPLVAVVFRRRPRSSSFCNSFCPPLFFLSVSLSLSLSLPSLFLSLLFCIRIRLVVYAPSADFKNGSIGLPNA